MVTNGEIKRNSSFRNMIISLVILGLIVILTLGIFIYNTSQQTKLDNLKSNLSSINNEIEEISIDPTIELYALVEYSSSNIEQYKKYSKITNFISEVESISGEHNINYSNFNYNNGSISLNSRVTNDEQSLATAKLDSFLSSFRSGEYEGIFELDFVNNFSGQENITFTTKFNLR